MITELVLTGLVYSGYKYLSHGNEHKLKQTFQSIMEGIGIKNKQDKTFKILYVNKTNYGFRSTIEIPYGLSKDMLESKIEILQDNLNSIIVLDKDRFKPCITMSMVNKDVDKFKYEPVKTKPYELYIGKEFQLQDFIINVRKDPHILIAGCTGTGKSFLLASILTNLIYNSKDYIEIYLLQISKSELSAFEDCSCIKEACYTPDSCFDTLNDIMKIIEERSEIFKENSIRNISQWNVHFKKQYMKEIYVVVEELSFFLDLQIITDISKIGRSVGVHIISCIQRSVATEMNSTLKSQMSKITFRQKSYIDSVNIIGNNEAKSLKERECIVDGNSDYIQLKTPWIDEDYVLLHKYVPDIKIPIKNKKKKQEVIINKQITDSIVIDEENMTVVSLDSHNLIEAEIVEEVITNKKRSDGIMDAKEFKKDVKGKRL